MRNPSFSLNMLIQKGNINAAPIIQLTESHGIQ